jgi:hypothetical protein
VPSQTERDTKESEYDERGALCVSPCYSVRPSERVKVRADRQKERERKRGRIKEKLYCLNADDLNQVRSGLVGSW